MQRGTRAARIALGLGIGLVRDEFDASGNRRGELLAETRRNDDDDVVLAGRHGGDRGVPVFGAGDDLDVVAAQVGDEVRRVLLADNGQLHRAVDVIE